MDREYCSCPAWLPLSLRTWYRSASSLKSCFISCPGPQRALFKRAVRSYSGNGGRGSRGANPLLTRGASTFLSAASNTRDAGSGTRGCGIILILERPRPSPLRRVRPQAVTPIWGIFSRHSACPGCGVRDGRRRVSPGPVAVRSWGLAGRPRREWNGIRGVGSPRFFRIVPAEDSAQMGADGRYPAGDAVDGGQGIGFAAVKDVDAFSLGRDGVYCGFGCGRFRFGPSFRQDFTVSALSMTAAAAPVGDGILRWMVSAQERWPPRMSAVMAGEAAMALLMPHLL